jgi:hypothetical protein
LPPCQRSGQSATTMPPLEAAAIALWVIGAALVVAGLACVRNRSKAPVYTLVPVGVVAVIAGLVMWGTQSRAAPAADPAGPVALSAAPVALPAAPVALSAAPVALSAAPVALPAAPAAPAATPAVAIPAVAIPAPVTSLAAAPQLRAPHSGARGRGTAVGDGEGEGEREREYTGRRESETPEQRAARHARRRAERRERRVTWAEEPHVRPFLASDPSMAARSPASPARVPAAQVDVVVDAGWVEPTGVVVPGYEPPFAEAPAVREGDLGSVLPAGGPAAFRSHSRFPTVEEAIEERQRYMARPDTPDLDRKRRMVALREAAATLRPMDPGFAVPIAVDGVPIATACVSAR